MLGLKSVLTKQAFLFENIAIQKSTFRKLHTYIKFHEAALLYVTTLIDLPIKRTHRLPVRGPVSSAEVFN